MCMCTKKMIVKVKKGIKTIIKIVKNTCFNQQKIKKNFDFYCRSTYDEVWPETEL